MHVKKAIHFRGFIITHQIHILTYKSYKVYNILLKGLAPKYSAMIFTILFCLHMKRNIVTL